MAGKARGWSKVPTIIKWQQRRQVEGAPLRLAVWRDLAHLRAALRNHEEGQ